MDIKSIFGQPLARIHADTDRVFITLGRFSTLLDAEEAWALANALMAAAADANAYKLRSKAA
jgi:hypothetical protein